MLIGVTGGVGGLRGWGGAAEGGFRFFGHFSHMLVRRAKPQETKIYGARSTRRTHLSAAGNLLRRC